MCVGGGGSLVLCPCLWFGSSCPFQFSIPLAEEKKAVYFTFIVFNCLCYVSLPRGAIGGSAVCNYDISRSYSPTF